MSEQRHLNYTPVRELPRDAWNRALRTDQSRIYFVQAGYEGPVKVGVAGGDLVARLTQLQTGNHESVILLTARTVPKDEAYVVERDIHEVFSALRIRGEWFAPEPELLDFVERVHDLAPLPRALHVAMVRLSVRTHAAEDDFPLITIAAPGVS